MFPAPLLRCLLNGQHRRKKFTAQEDEKLLHLVNQLGTSNWAAISEKMPGRNPRQVRDRYFNYLSPDVVNGPWTQTEDDLLMTKYNELGPTWKRIAAFFPTRTDINVKSRYQKLVRRQRKMARKAAALMPVAVPHAVPLSNPIEPVLAPIQNKSSDPMDFFDFSDADCIWNSVLMNSDMCFDECFGGM